MKLLKKNEVTKVGWYVGIEFTGEEPGDTDVPWHFVGQTFLYEFDDEGIWRSTSGHGITIEDPEYFDRFDRFLGPIEWKIK